MEEEGAAIELSAVAEGEKGNDPPHTSTIAKADKEAESVVDNRSVRSERGDWNEDTSNLLFDLLHPDQFSTLTRRVLKTVILLGLLAVLVAICLVAVVTSVKRVEAGFPIEDASSLRFELDSCSLVFQNSDSQRSGAVKVEIENSKDVVVEIEGKADLVVRVENKKALHLKYVNYFCSVKVFVPEGTVLPTTTVHAQGRLLTSIVSFEQNWGPNDLILTSEFPNTQMKVNLEDSIVNNLNITIDSGVFNVKRGTFSSVNIESVDANFFIETKQSVVVDTQLPSTSTCLNGYSYECFGPSNGTCNSLGVAAIPNQILDPTDLSPIRVSCSQCFLHLIAVQDRADSKGQLVTYGGTSEIAFSAFDKQRIQEAFGKLPTREMVYIDIQAPGLKADKWVWSSRTLYLAFHPVYLDVFSFFLLSPLRAHVNVTLTPSFCPGLETEVDLDVSIAVDALLKSTVSPVPNPESVYAFREVKRGLLDDTSTLYSVVRDDDSGEYYLLSPGFINSPRLLILLITNLAVTVLSAGYLSYLGMRQFWKWRSKKVKKWGYLYYGQDWQRFEQETLNRAGLFFMAEFLIGFPKQKRHLYKMVLTVFLHMFLIFAIVFPIFVASLIALVSSGTERYETSLGLPIMGFIYCGAYIVIALGNLILYYWNFSWNIVRFIAWPFMGLTAGAVFLSLLYVMNISFWVVLGALIKPNQILPYASVVVVIIAHVVATYVRVRDLREKLDESEKKALAESDATMKEENERSFTFSGKLTVNEGLRILKEVELLEIKDLSVREEILQEIVVLIILCLFFVFVLVGFTSLSTNQDVSAAVGSVLVFVVGGGINVPLSSTHRQEDKRKQWEKAVRKEAAKRTGAKPKNE